MIEITHLMDKYRESTRHLWNIYFKEMEIGSHEFIDVDMSLFQGLVLTHIGDACYPGNSGVYETIHVIPEVPPSGCLEVAYCSKEFGEWQSYILKSNEGEFFFRCFFDWRSSSDSMDNEFVQVYVNKSKNDEINEKYILFKYSDVKFFAKELVSLED